MRLGQHGAHGVRSYGLQGDTICVIQGYLNGKHTYAMLCENDWESPNGNPIGMKVVLSKLTW